MMRHRQSGPASRRRQGSGVPVLWLVFAGTAAVMIAAAAVLALSPAQIKASITRDEVYGLIAGLALMLVVQLLFLRSALAPLRRLAGMMGSVDLLQQGRRIGDVGRASREVGLVAGAFDAMLERLEAERRESTRRVLAAQEGERLRVARELHDELGQALTAVALRAERAATGAAPAAVLREIADALERSVNEVRRIARELRPEALDDLGLVDALISMCTRVAASGGPRIERRFQPGLPPLGDDADLVIYRVAQEALTNAVRHSGAGHVAIALGSHGDRIVLTVRDDGCGPPAVAEHGGGIAGMRERALLVGGRLELDAVPGGGTEVRLSLPVPGTPPSR